MRRGLPTSAMCRGGTAAGSCRPRSTTNPPPVCVPCRPANRVRVRLNLETTGGGAASLEAEGDEQQVEQAVALLGDAAALRGGGQPGGGGEADGDGELERAARLADQALAEEEGAQEAEARLTAGPVVQQQEQAQQQGPEQLAAFAGQSQQQEQQEQQEQQQGDSRSDEQKFRDFSAAVGACEDLDCLSKQATMVGCCVGGWVLMGKCMGGWAGRPDGCVAVRRRSHMRMQAKPPMLGRRAPAPARPPSPFCRCRCWPVVAGAWAWAVPFPPLLLDRFPKVRHHQPVPVSARQEARQAGSQPCHAAERPLQCCWRHCVLNGAATRLAGECSMCTAHGAG